MKRIQIGLLALLWPVLMFGQRRSEVMLITDNDLYSSPINDQYYTAGFEFIYRYQLKDTVRKKINEFRIGQYIYNPQSVRAADINVNDRPFAGYLFAEAGFTRFPSANQLFKYTFQAGVLGPESGAEQVQRGLHQLVGYPTVRGWEYQITTTLGLQAEAFYSVRVKPNWRSEPDDAPKWDFHLQGHLNLGTIWTSATVGGLARISLKGPLESISNSVMYHAALGHDRDELFLYFNPQLQYMNYDATILGSHFNDDSPVTFPLIELRFNAELGIRYRRNNWNYSYSVNYRGKELSNNVITGFYYGSIMVGYFF